MDHLLRFCCRICCQKGPKINEKDGLLNKGLYCLPDNLIGFESLVLPTSPSLFCPRHFTIAYFILPTYQKPNGNTKLK